MHWLLTGEGPQRSEQLVGKDGPDPASQGLGLDSLKIAFQVVAEALGPMTATTDQHFELVTISAELLQDGFPEAKVLAIVKRTAKALMKGEDDDGSSKGDAASAGVR